MNYTRAMIDLVKEIRRRAPSEIKPSIKLANPDLLTELTLILDNSSDIIVVSLIKEFINLADDSWSMSASAKKHPSLMPSERAEREKPSAKFSSQRIYRGQLVVD